MDKREAIRQVLSSWLGASDCSTATDQIMKRLDNSGVTGFELPVRLIDDGTECPCMLDASHKRVAYFVDAAEGRYAVGLLNSFEAQA